MILDDKKIEAAARRYSEVTDCDKEITCELSPFIVKLESVSDLQHLLFGLGIKHEMEV